MLNVVVLDDVICVWYIKYLFDDQIFYDFVIVWGLNGYVFGFVVIVSVILISDLCIDYWMQIDLKEFFVFFEVCS